MALAQSIAFIALAGLLIALASFAFVRLGLLRLESPIGIIRDGLPSGTRAPGWRLTDTEGQFHEVPSQTAWQLLLFSDHSIREFPGLVRGISDLGRQELGLMPIMLPRKDPRIAAATVEAMGLDISVVPVDDDFYWRHNVRVTPFVLIVDPNGSVRAAGLAQDEERLAHIWHLSRIDFNLDASWRITAKSTM